MLVCILTSKSCDLLVTSCQSSPVFISAPFVSLSPRFQHNFQLEAMRLTNPTTPHRTFSPLIIYIFMLSTPYVLWHSLCAMTHTSSPIVVVTSESMEPVYHRGDVLFISNRNPSIDLGDIVVCWLEDRKLPFVHRVIEKHILSVGIKGSSKYRERDNCDLENGTLIKIVRTPKNPVIQPLAS